MDFQASEPACENVRSNLRLQARTDPFEKRIMLHVGCNPRRLLRSFLRERLSCIFPVCECTSRPGRIHLHLAAFHAQFATSAFLPAPFMLAVPRPCRAIARSGIWCPDCTGPLIPAQSHFAKHKSVPTDPASCRIRSPVCGRAAHSLVERPAGMPLNHPTAFAAFNRQKPMVTKTLASAP